MTAEGRLRPEAVAGEGVGRDAASPSPASPWARVVQPGRNACDGFPKCRYEGKGADLRDHMRGCSDSDAGAIYRVLAWHGSLS